MSSRRAEWTRSLQGCFASCGRCWPRDRISHIVRLYLGTAIYINTDIWWSCIMITHFQDDDFVFVVDQASGDVILDLIGFSEQGPALPEKLLMRFERCGWCS